ncbi:MAG: hypothetical protein WCV85_00835 [Patescibacteria group bacterium]|jgi:hypothetical protein
MKRSFHFCLRLLALSTLLFQTALAWYTTPPTPTILDHAGFRTTVAAWGAIGGYPGLDLPSFEWPAGSGRNYLGECGFLLNGATKNHEYIASTTNELMGVVQPDGTQKPVSLRRAPLILNDTLTSFMLEQTETILNDQSHGSTFLCTLRTSTTDAPLFTGCLFLRLTVVNCGTENFSPLSLGLYLDADIGESHGFTDAGRLDDAVGAFPGLLYTYDVDGYDQAWGSTVTPGVIGSFIANPFTESQSRIGEFGNFGHWSSRDIFNGDMENLPLTKQNYDCVYYQYAMVPQLPPGQSTQLDFVILVAPSPEALQAKAVAARIIASTILNQ